MSVGVYQGNNCCLLCVFFSLNFLIFFSALSNFSIFSRFISNVFYITFAFFIILKKKVFRMGRFYDIMFEYVVSL